MVSGIGLGDLTQLVPGSGSKMVKGSSLSGACCTGKVVGDGYQSSGEPSLSDCDRARGEVANGQSEGLSIILLQYIYLLQVCTCLA